MKKTSKSFTVETISFANSLLKQIICIFFILNAFLINDVYGEVLSNNQATVNQFGRIFNRATAQFIDQKTGSQSTLYSNTVEVILQPVSSVVLETPQTITTVAGVRAVFPQTVVNTGNHLDMFDLKVIQGVGDYQFSSIQIYEDSNQDSIPDSLIPLTATPTLQPNQEFHFVVEVFIPNTAQLQDKSQVLVQASPNLNFASSNSFPLANIATNSHLVKIDNLPNLRITKSVNETRINPNGLLNYTIKIVNDSNEKALGTNLNIDGQTFLKVLLEDTIPANTSFVSSIVPSFPNLQPLYHIAGTPSRDFITVIPTDLTKIDKIAYVFNEINPNQLIEMKFAVKANTSARGFIQNQAFVFANDLLIQMGSNTTKTPVIADGDDNNGNNGNGGSGNSNSFGQTISFYNPTFSRPIYKHTPGQPLYVLATAGLCNRSSSNIDQINTTTQPQKIRISSLSTGDSEEFEGLEVDEQGQASYNTGLFRTLPSNVPTRQTATAIQGNGIIETIAGDKLRAELQCKVGNTSQISQISNLIGVDPIGTVFDVDTNQPIPNTGVSIYCSDSHPQRQNLRVCRADGKAVVYLDQGLQTVADEGSNIGATGITSQINSWNSSYNLKEGEFWYPFVYTGSYYLVLDLPDGYDWFRTRNVPYSYNRILNPGGSFQLRDLGNGLYQSGLFPVEDGIVTIDIPLQRKVSNNDLMIQKTSNKQQAEIGEAITYNLILENKSTTTIVPDVRWVDAFPQGFSYVEDSLKIVTDERKVAPKTFNPVIDGQALSIEIGNLEAKGKIAIEYRLKLNPRALQGNGTNYSQAFCRGIQCALIAQNKVDVQAGVFSDKAYIIGKVFTDCDRDRVQGAKEIGIPGVRLYLQDGTYTITDAEGKYSFYGLQPQTHVVRLDDKTLPVGSELLTLSNRQGLVANSSFVDLKNGELQKVNFAEGSCNSAVMEDVKKRRSQSVVQEIARATQVLFEAQQRLFQEEVRLKSAQGIIGTSSVVNNPNENNVNGISAAASELALEQGLTPNANTEINNVLNNSLNNTNTSANKNQTLEEAIIDKMVEKTIQLLNVKLSSDNKTIQLNSRQIPLQLLAPQGTLQLTLNGEKVSDKKMGKRIERETDNAYEYIGLDMNVGKNELSASIIDSFGNERFLTTWTLIAPDSVAKISLGNLSSLIADGQTISVPVQLQDKSNLSVAQAHILNVDLPQDIVILTPDAQPQEAGWQVWTDKKGFVDLKVKAPLDPRTVPLIISLENIKISENLVFNPQLRDFLAVGLIEGVFDFRKLDPRQLQGIDGRDSFEKELNNIGNRDENKQLNVRGAAFLKGKVKGDYLLTLAYDSEKARNSQLFRDIQPDQFYPIYGDDSIRGFDAQSTSRLYVRVDKGQSFVMYGDFSTQGGMNGQITNNGIGGGNNLQTTNASANTNTDVPRQITQYQRPLTGVKTHVQGEKYSVDAFVAQEKAQFKVEEIAPKGITGPYFLTGGNWLFNSEKVELIVRDRLQPTLILKTIPQTRFTDYQFEALTGRLVFNQPISSTDEDFNPVTIRVSYTVENNQGDAYWVSGVDATYHINDVISVGGQMIRSNEDNNSHQLNSVYGQVKITDKTKLTAEVGQSEQADQNKKGIGSRLELTHQGEKLEARVYQQKLSANYQNQPVIFNGLDASIQGQGRTEQGVRVQYRATNDITLQAEGLRSEQQTDVNTNQFAGQSQTMIRAGVQTKVTNGINVDVNVRQLSNASGDTTQDAQTSASIGAKVQLPKIPNLSATGEYERDIQDTGRIRYQYGLEYQFMPTLKAYLRHETLKSFGNLYQFGGNGFANSLNGGTIFGVSMQRDQSNLYSEYRLRDAIEGRTAQAALGLRRTWALGSENTGVKLLTNFERIHPIVRGDVAQTNNPASTALGLGLDYQGSDQWKGSSMIEWLHNAQYSQMGYRVNVATKLNQDWTSLARFSMLNTTGQNNSTFYRLQTGAAYRPVDSDRWNSLLKWETRREDAQNNLIDTNILSAHLHFQPMNRLNVSGRIAQKWLRQQDNESNQQLLMLRTTHDLTKTWDMSLIGSVFGQDGFQKADYGLGAEIGYLVGQQTWLSLGYQWFDSNDRDFSFSQKNSKGVYARFRYKFDEELFNRQ